MNRTVSADRPGEGAPVFEAPGTVADRIEGGWKLDHSFARLPGEFFAQVQPTPVASPKLVLLNRSLAAELGLEPEVLGRAENAGWFTGNSLPPGAFPIAQAYAGHQFGNFVVLGDGRAILLGEQLTPRGERFDIQLKGPGRTPYSRQGDGRAALGPMLREYIISEAMHGLGIPTTRSLAVAATGEPVYRETTLPGAILTRVAASHLRVGNVEWAAATGDPGKVRVIADYTLQRHYPQLVSQEQRYLLLLQALLERQAKLIASWMHVGFIHGVMNTDNMALSGETIDYGPCAFMNVYDPGTVFSSIDHHGRYAYANQPRIALWNLSCLASALLPLLDEKEEEALAIANKVLAAFPEVFKAHWLRGMRGKLGLHNEEPEDEQLADDLFKVMHEQRLDFTNTFRDLSSEMENTDTLAAKGLGDWGTRWHARLHRQSQDLSESQALMRRNNPAFIPRNHKVEEALAAASSNGDLTVAEKLLEIVAQPFDYGRHLREFSTPSPDNDGYQTFCGT
jgi:serine/tyrosine/threonine adenylyltransferase